MKCEIISIGSEITSGRNLDTNSQWLSRRLAEVGIPVGWRVFIREWDPPYRFVDVQVRGPYARWEHRHRFLEGDGGTWMEDRVTYRLPLGPIGRVAHALLVGRQLAAMWRYRTGRLEALIGSVSSPAA